VVKFGRQVPVILCGDINANVARWVGIYSESVPVRKVVDESKNSQGEVLVDFLRGMKMTIVYGRKGKNTFTCVSEKGCSVVYYCIMGSEDFDVVKNFMVTTMSEGMVEMVCKGAVSRVPDHSLLHWQVVVNGVGETKENECESG